MLNVNVKETIDTVETFFFFFFFKLTTLNVRTKSSNQVIKNQGYGDFYSHLIEGMI